MQKNCFVIMSFDPKFNGIWEAVIKPTIESINDQPIRVDNIFTTTSVLNDILNNITSADYLIADLTFQNPNVYYELGYAHALKKNVIIITQDISSLPFDLRHQRAIVYQDSAAGAVKLKNDLINFINKF